MYKKLTACALAAFVAGGALALLSACSGGDEELDYTTATYSQLKDVDWDQKTVQYQFLNDRLDGYGAYWPICLNLYSDGSAAAWQATVTGFHVTHYADEEHYILWDFYGYWTSSADRITINLKGEGYSVVSDFGTNVTPTELTYSGVQIDSQGSGSIADFVCMASVGTDIKGMVTCDGTVHYKTFTDFYNSYKDEFSEE